MSAALHPDGASVGLDEGLADGQPQACATRVLPTTVPRPVKTLEHVWQLIGVDARAIIRNRDYDAIVAHRGCDMHLALAIDQRVSDQVVEHNLYARRVHVHRRQ